MQRGRSGASSFLPTGDSGKGEGWRWGHRLCPAPNTKIQWWGDKPSAVAPTPGGLGESSGTGGALAPGFARASARAPKRPGLKRWIQQPVVEQALVALGCGRAVTMDDKGSFGICFPHQWQLTTTTLIWDCDCRFGTMIWDCDCGFGTMIQNL
ncbi:hypothetical protein OsJ_30574 [Oryza sativa Japonica Group]|uniref:Uncharacterized protein n=1 Tax=Oryza sativa subsp. japonica TaxID=39947 RepID=A3C246_ORYSJ|nr:hypothetical protein OsJ_30574 [Oryza sativa Japonica Group]